MDENYSRRDFGNWLAGFTDGEGCFLLQSGNRHGKWTGFTATFRIKLRADDLPILEKIRDYMNCGTLDMVNASRKKERRDKPQALFAVRAVPDLLFKVIPIFDTCPLRAKKARDYETWKLGVELLNKVQQRPLISNNGRGNLPRWHKADKEAFMHLVNTMRSVRAFDNSEVKPVQIITRPERADLYLF